MEKERKIKSISLVALIVAVLSLSIAFAALSANLVINGTAKVEAGKWDIYFENLSEAILNGGAKVAGKAIINDENKTMIQDINVTLTKPMDEVVYTVELKNDGDIDAEISSINGPTFTDEVKKYVVFSAIYEDNKAITVGDVLKSGTTENVTISVKFKDDVTSLPEDNLNVDLSYEINYVQSSKQTDKNVHKGEDKGISTPQIDYDKLEKGNEITLDTEGFYVLKNDDENLTLISKYNLLVGNIVTYNDLEFEQPVSITPIPTDTKNYGRQSIDAKALISTQTTWTGTIEFATKTTGNYGYWQDENGNLKASYGSSYPANVYDVNSNLYKYVEDYKNYLKGLGYKIKDARLMTYEEALELGCTFDSIDKGPGTCQGAPKWLYQTSYWLGSSQGTYENDSFVWGITSDGSFYVDVFSYNYDFGLRPVIIIDKSV